MSGVRYPAAVKAAALALSQEIGPLHAARSLRLRRQTVQGWRREAQMPALPRGAGRFESIDKKCIWCGDEMPRPGLHTKNAEGLRCRAAYLASFKETTHATK